MNPILGDLNGYWSGSSTWIVHTPPANGAEADVFSGYPKGVCKGHTFNGAFECDDKLLQAIVHEAHIVV